MPQGTEYTKQRAEWFSLPPQDKGESDQAFRERVSGAIRALGHPIEAHEAFCNCLYDDLEANANGAGPLVGIMGAVAFEMSGRNFGSDGVHQVGDDIAAGAVARQKRMTPEEAMLMMLLMGRDR